MEENKQVIEVETMEEPEVQTTFNEETIEEMIDAEDCVIEIPKEVE